MSIYTEDLTKVCDSTHALDGVSISVDQGAILGVVGSSGSGKSTLVRNIALLERQLLPAQAVLRRAGQ